MTQTVTRRNAIKGAAMAVVGWSVGAGSWVTAADALPDDLAPLPPLDGVLETDPAVLRAFSEDFGNLVTATPRAVLRPGSIGDIQKMVRYCRRNELQIAMNGQSGTGDDIESHSSFGQAGVPGGVSIDARALSTIHSIDPTRAVVDAGVTWAELAQAAAAVGATPASLTDYLHLSIGGTVSVGGFGGLVHRFGSVADTVEQVEVVTGTGRHVRASPTERPRLFEAVVAGAGQAAIIVKLEVKLVPIHERARACSLFYDDLATYMADQETIVGEARFEHIEGEIARKPDDSGWRYRIEAVAYYTPPDEPDVDALLAGLSDHRDELEVLDLTYFEWIFRITPFEAFLKANGFWGQPKPWVSLILPPDETRAFIEDVVVAELTPGDLGAGFTGLYPVPRAKLTRPLMAKPGGSSEFVYLFDVLRFPVPGDPNIGAMLEQNRRWYDAGVAVGAKRYLVGAVPDLTQADWRRHFGPEWGRLVQAKRRWDPDNVLTPGAGFFPDGVDDDGDDDD